MSFLFALLALTAAAPKGPLPAPRNTHYVHWVTNATHKTGGGYKADPFLVSSADELDALLLKRLREHTTIYLGTNAVGTTTFITYGGGHRESWWRHPLEWHLPKGARLIGQGMDRTVLALTPEARPQPNPAPGRIAVATLTDLPGDSVIVSDLTVDLAVSPEARPVSTCAVAVSGDYAAIRRVRVIHGGTRTNAEAFLLVAGCPITRSNVTGLRIEDCVVEQCDPRTDDRAGICAILVGASWSYGLMRQATDAVIARCRVDGSTYPPTKAFAALGCKDAAVEDCVSINCDFGFYVDSWRTESVSLRRNRFVNAANAVQWVLGGSAHSHQATLGRAVLEDNVFLLAPRGPGRYPPHGVYLWAREPVQHLEFTRNFVGWSQPPTNTSAATGFVFEVHNVAHIQARDNWLALDGPWGQRMHSYGAGAVDASGNRTLPGDLIRWTNQ